jgi:hypothetical protein
MYHIKFLCLLWLETQTVPSTPENDLDPWLSCGKQLRRAFACVDLAELAERLKEAKDSQRERSHSII